MVKRLTPKLIEQVLDDIRGGKSLRQSLRERNGPGHSAWTDRASKDPDFAAHYARALDARAEKLFDELLDIADETKHDLTGDNKVDYENIQRSRLRVDTRKWVLSKMMPKKYGERLDSNVNVSGSLGIVDVINMANRRAKKDV